jgi:hypothetical protein
MKSSMWISGTAADLSWSSSANRRTYKLLSAFLLHNVSILHPLNFLEAFVQHLLLNKQVPQVQQVLGLPGGSKHKAAYDPAELAPMLRETDGL